MISPRQLGHLQRCLTSISALLFEPTKPKSSPPTLPQHPPDCPQSHAPFFAWPAHAFRRRRRRLRLSPDTTRRHHTTTTTTTSHPRPTLTAARHRKTPISELVYRALYPNPSPTDPPSFSAHLSKNLVGEVRIETANFYGSLDTIEARYPGLNYAHAPHRKRLGRFPHHRKLFDAFNRLGLTESEIQGFCRWEGTLWARERYERDEGVRVIDTTGMEIGPWVDNRGAARHAAKGINVKTDIEVEIEQMPHMTQQHRHHHQRHADTEMRDDDDDDDDNDDDNDNDNAHEQHHSSEDDSEDELEESVGFELNQRLLHAAALRDQGANVPMDPEWEQYLKEAQERGELNIDATRQALRTMAGQLAQHMGQAAQTSASSSVPTQHEQPQAFQPPAAPA